MAKAKPRKRKACPRFTVETGRRIYKDGKPLPQVRLGGLAGTSAQHAERAAFLIGEAERFLVAMERPNATCAARLQQAEHARVYGEMAVHEATWARKRGKVTPLDRRAVDVADQATRASSVVSYHCSRGFSRFKSTAGRLKRTREGKRHSDY